MRKLLLTGAAAFIIGGCAMSEDRIESTYPLQVSGRNAILKTVSYRNKIANYTIDFGDTYGVSLMAPQSGRDLDKNGIPDIEMISVECEAFDSFFNEFKRTATIYNRIGARWVAQDLMRCDLPVYASALADSAEQIAAKIIENR